VQHGVVGVPDLATGYTTDDNARAFLAMVRLWRALRKRAAEFEPLLRRYLAVPAWVQHRDGDNAGWFVNFVSYDRPVPGRARYGGLPWAVLLGTPVRPFPARCPGLYAARRRCGVAASPGWPKSVRARPCLRIARPVACGTRR